MEGFDRQAIREQERSDYLVLVRQRTNEQAMVEAFVRNMLFR